DHYLKALKFRRKLVADDRGSVAAKIDLALSCVKDGNASEGDAARTYYLEALELRKELEEPEASNANPAVPASRRRDVWVVCNRRGDLSLRERDVATAIAYYREGLERAEVNRQLAPKSAAARQTLSVSLENLGAAHRQRGDAAQARDLFVQALNL